MKRGIPPRQDPIPCAKLETTMDLKSYFTSFKIWLHTAISVVAGAFVAAIEQYVQNGVVIPTTAAAWHTAIVTIVASALMIMAANLKQSPIQK